MPKSSTVRKVGEGLGLAALAAAGAATYYFYGKDGKKHKAQVGAWLKKAQGDMQSKVKDLKTFSKKSFDEVTKEVMAKYKQVKSLKPEEMAILGSQLKKHADMMYKEVSKFSNKKLADKPAAKKPARKTKSTRTPKK